jgi:hypothetical protein
MNSLLLWILLGFLGGLVDMVAVVSGRQGEDTRSDWAWTAKHRPWLFASAWILGSLLGPIRLAAALVGMRPER